MSHLDGAVRRMVEEVPDGFPSSRPPAGAAVALHHQGADLTAAAGLRTLDGLAMTVDTHHDMASVTKGVATTAAIMRLVSDGQVHLDQPVARLLPGFVGGQKSSVTIRHLLLHRGGLQDWLPVYLFETEPAAALRCIEERPLAYPVGRERHYSDLGFMLLGRVIEAATGQYLHDAVRSLVTEPLAMASTRYAAPGGTEVAASALDDRVEMAMVAADTEYRDARYRDAECRDGRRRDRQFDRWRRVPVMGEVNDGNAQFCFHGISGHAGLFSTLGDLIRFGTAMADYAEHDRLWKPQMVEEFFAPGPDPGQSLGWRRYDLDLGTERVVLLGHTGFVGCAFGFVPGRGIALAMCTNRLLNAATPLATDLLWAQVIEAASEEITNRTALVPR